MKSIAAIILALTIHSNCYAETQTLDVEVDPNRPTEKVELKLTYQKKITGDELKSDIFKEVFVVSNIPIYGETHFRISASGKHVPNSICKKLGYEKGADDALTRWSFAADWVRVVVTEDLKFSFENSGAIYIDFACLK